MGEPLLYIASPSYSGSTLLTILLQQHAAIASVGELKASAFGDIEQYPCSCGSRLLACPFWLSVTERLSSKGLPFSLEHWQTQFASSDPLRNRILATTLKHPALESLRSLGFAAVPSARKEQQELLDRNQAIIDAVLELTGRTVFLDGSKDPVRAKYFMDSGRWDVKIVILIRDGRGFTNSYMRHESVDMDRAIDEWLFKVQELQRLQRLAGNNAMVVRYEDLCNTPVEVLNRILSFCGQTPLSRLEFPLGYADRHILGNAMRLKEITEVRIDEKWRTSLQPADLTRFYERAGRHNREFGYESHEAVA